MSTSRRLGIVVLALVLAVAAFFVFRPDDTARRDEKGQTESDGERSGERSSGVEEIRVAGGEPVGGVRTVSFRSGETVRLAFTSDSAGEVHIHGYDRYVDLKAGRTVRVSFPAELEGVFEVEGHGTGTQLARLRVQP